MAGISGQGLKEIMPDLAKVLPYILGAAVSPILLVTTLYILALPKDPIKKSMLYLLGGTATIGILTFFIFYTTTFNPNPAPNKDLAPHMIIGVLLLFLAYGIYSKGPAKAKKQDSNQRKPWGYLGLGFLLMVTNFTTLAMIFEVALELRANHVAGGDKVIYLIANVISSIAPILLPLLILLITGKYSKSILEALSSFMAKYAHIVTAIFFAVLGIFSLLKPFI
jgi:Sap, sulfolipid-1-addressing protein